MNIKNEDFQKLTTEQLEQLAKDSFDKMQNFVSSFNPAFSVVAGMSGDEAIFSITHNEYNWTKFLDIYISQDGTCKFNHGSGGWKSDVYDQEVLLEASIEGMLIGRAIMSMKENIIPLIKNITKSHIRISDIKRKNFYAAQERAREVCVKGLEERYTKTNQNEILDIIKRDGRVELILPEGYDEKNDIFTTETICVIDKGYGWANSRLNLYLLYNDPNRYSTNGSYNFECSTSKADLRRFNSDTFLYTYEEEAV